MNWFAHIVVRYPYVIIIAVSVFATACIIVPLTTNKLPNFSDPLLGFEARGTELAQRLTAWKNLLEESKPSGSLIVNPHEHSVSISTRAPKVQIEITEEVDVANRTSDIEADSLQQDNWKTLHNMELDGYQHMHHHMVPAGKELIANTVELEDEEDEEPHHHHQHLAEDGFFCDTPHAQYSRVVFTTTDGSDLFDVDSIHSMCYIEEYLTSRPEFKNLCQTVSHDICCPVWSLGNYIALLHNKSSCFEVSSADVDSAKRLLETCAPFFNNLTLSPKCMGKKYCEQIPRLCKIHDVIYNILYYVADIDFFPANVSTHNRKLHSATSILPIAQSVGTLQYYNSLETRFYKHGKVKIVGMNFGLKNALFNEVLVKDTWMIGAGGIFVLLSMWIYTGSLFITFMTVIAIAFSLAISYVTYTFLFKMHFFPFMNLLAAVVAVGIGADDAFIYCKIWQCTKAEKNNVTVLKLVVNTLRHAAVSMFVCSLTTAAAFYSSFVSQITAVCCFSVFAGTATLANFILMITWLPAAVIVSERWCCPPMVPFQWLAMDSKVRSVRAAAEQACAAIDRFLVCLVIRCRYLWLLVLGSIAVGSVVVVFYYPRLKLPDSKDFQLFQSHHPFEEYDLVYKYKFWYQRLHKVFETDIDVNARLPLRFIWGVLPLDNGDYLDPNSRGSLQFDDSFDMADPASQEWLLKFCRRLRKQSFFQPLWGPLLPNCFMEQFSDFMRRECIDRIDNLNRTPCCNMHKAPPFKREVFEQCIVVGIAALYESPAEIFVPGIAGPKFCKGSHPPKVCAVVVEFESKHLYSLSFKQMNKFYNQVDKWSKNQMSNAPPGMRNGWFISELEFYDLQNTLSRDTLIAIGVSMTVALTVLIFVTLNILISLFAIITITCIIFVTVGILVLLGWKLNVLESIAMSVAIGLAVDFSLHYGVHYRMCPDNEDRHAAVTYAITRMGSPTIMAALTTAAAGAFMLPSQILAYIQIGVFLIVMMLVSWIYSTFFLGAFLSIFGPQKGFGQFSYASLTKCCRSQNEHISGANARSAEQTEKSVCTNVLSESTLSTSSTLCALHPSTPESHELEALTTRKHSNKRLKRSGSASTAQQSSSNRLVRKVSLPIEQSPSATSATTIVLVDDYDFDSRLGMYNTEQPLLK